MSLKKDLYQDVSRSVSKDHWRVALAQLHIILCFYVLIRQELLRLFSVAHGGDSA